MLKNRSLASLLFSNFSITLIGFITGLILAKFASLEVRGEIGKIIVWVTFGVNLITLGTIEYYYSKGVNKKLVVNKLVYIAVTIFLIFFISIFFYFNDLGRYVYYIFFLVPMNLYSLHRISELNLCGYFMRLSIIKIIQPFSYLIILSFFLFTKGLVVDNILWANIISNFILVVGLFLIFNLNHLNLNRYLEESSEIKFSKEWILVNFSSILGVIVSNFDKVYITYKYNLEDIALYLVGLTIVGAPLGIIGQTYATKFIYVSKEGIGFKSIFIYVFLTLLVGIGVYYISPILLLFIFKDKYNGILNIILSIIFLSSFINFRLVLIRIIRSLGLNKEILNAELYLAMGVFLIILASIVQFIHINDSIESFVYVCAIVYFFNILYLLLILYKERLYK